jgi:hypothetical protein
MRHRFKTAEYERSMQRFLYQITHRFTGMPNADIYWNYPDVFLWDGLTPDLVAIYFNIELAYPYEKRRALELQLAHHFPPRWDCYWLFDQGHIWAERRDFNEPSIFPPEIQNKNRHAAHQYDLQLSQNGHKEMLEDENVVFMVPQYESD